MEDAPIVLMLTAAALVVFVFCVIKWPDVMLVLCGLLALPVAGPVAFIPVMLGAVLAIFIRR